MSTDEKIKKIIDESLLDAKIDDSKISVDVDDGIVRLTGEIPNWLEMKKVENKVYNIPGVKHIDNKLVIILRLTFKDDEILKNIQDFLTWTSYINISKIKISVKKGLVIVDGLVDAYWKKIKLENLILNIKGVTGIINKLAIVPTKDIIDEKIAKEIMASMEKHLNLDLYQISVEIEKGNVTISGNVSSWTAYKITHNVVNNISGVINVIDNLTIDTP